MRLKKLKHPPFIGANKINTALFFILFLFPEAGNANSGTSAKKLSVIGLKQAIESKMVSVQVTGADMPGKFSESVDQEGLHFGKCMAISIKSNIDSGITIKLDCGTLLSPDDSDVQIMVATHDVSIALKAGKSYATKIYAMCTQMHRYAPTVFEKFKVGERADTTLLKLVKYIELTYNQNIIGQHALWAYTDKADKAQLEEYGADNNSIEKTAAMLDATHIVTLLNKLAEAPVIPKLATQSHTQDDYPSYCLAGLLSLLTVCSIGFNLKNIFAAKPNNKKL